MKRIFTYIALLFFYTALPAQDKAAYDTLMNRVSRLPSEEIIRLGDEYLKKEKPDTAIVLYSIVYSRFREDMSEEEKRFCAVGYLRMGNVYYLQGNYTNALDLYIKGLKICELCKDKTEMPRFYNNIGNVYSIFQDYEKGINYYEKGYKLCKIVPDKEVEYNILTNLTGICSYIKDSKRARKYYSEAEKFKQPGDTVKHYLSLLDRGLILKSEGKYKEAITNFRQAADFSLKNKMGASYVCSSYEELFRTYGLMNEDDSTMYYLDLCRQLAEKNKLLHLYSQTLKTLSGFYEDKGDVKRAMRYKSKYLSITDSIFNVREFNRVKNLQYLYEMEKTTQEISTLQAGQEKKEEEIRQQRRILISILSGTFVISLLLAVAYIQKRRLQRSYRDLFHINREIIDSQKQNKEIQQQYKEKLQQKDERLVAALKELNRYRKLNADSPVQVSGEKAFPEDFENSVKYQSSGLNNDQKQVLIEAINHIMENTEEFCKDDFSLEKLAALVNSNSKYVSQAINETYKKNFSNYINEYRIRQARIRLMDIEHYGHYTIKAIAESVGYKSHATFINVFRKITGITPSIYQKMAREQT